MSELVAYPRKRQQLGRYLGIDGGASEKRKLRRAYLVIDGGASEKRKLRRAYLAIDGVVSEERKERGAYLAIGPNPVRAVALACRAERISIATP